jgi:hypothetical protein
MHAISHENLKQQGSTGIKLARHNGESYEIF